jgi:hypothetical protein
MWEKADFRHQLVEKGTGDTFFDNMGFSRCGTRKATLFGSEFLKALIIFAAETRQLAVVGETSIAR